MQIERSRDRIKKTGEVFTPQWLVDEMLMKLYAQDATLFTSARKTFLEPSCGDGNFLVRILHYKLTLNNDNDPNVVGNILRAIYGIDLMPDNVQLAKIRMLDVIKAHLADKNISNKNMQKRLKTYQAILDRNIVCGSALDWDFDNWRPMPKPQLKLVKGSAKKSLTNTKKAAKKAKKPVAKNQRKPLPQQTELQLAA